MEMKERNPETAQEGRTRIRVENCEKKMAAANYRLTEQISKSEELKKDALRQRKQKLNVGPFVLHG